MLPGNVGYLCCLLFHQQVCSVTNISHFRFLLKRMTCSYNDLYIIFGQRTQSSYLNLLGELSTYHLHKICIYPSFNSSKSYVTFWPVFHTPIALSISSLLNQTQVYFESQNSQLSSHEGRCPKKPKERGKKEREREMKAYTSGL